MKSRAYIQGPYRHASRGGLAARIASETMYAFGGLAVAVYLCYTLLLG